MSGTPDNIYGYNPSPAAAIIFVVLFGITTVWHIWIMIQRRAFYFVVLIIGGGLEIAGYICRFLGHDNTGAMTLYIVQTLTILVAPALFAASIYMVLGRLVRLVQSEAYSPISPSLLTKIFVGGDILSFVVQIAGSGLLTSNFNVGKAIILVGLATQIVFFALFVVCATIFHRRLSRVPTSTSLRLDQEHKMQWRDITRVIFIASALVFVRSIFRFVEFTGGMDSPMLKTEAYLYICDSTLMFLVLAVLVYWHPSKYIGTGVEHSRVHNEEMY
ncbi:RTA-like protein [Penicillium brevicompactum]|uniref:RTA-like protein n=1 Tax=Penicillium brevicompactum TaxID=5074 RepID=A0A9W9QLX0_PENBR|nr:RTA-like protein [Penicillium brevicompactum]